MSRRLYVHSPSVGAGLTRVAAASMVARIGWWRRFEVKSAVAMLSQAMLLVKGGPDDGSSIPLSGTMVAIGRAPQNDIVLDQEGVSRQHASIHGDADGYWILDLESSNGTFLNGERIGGDRRRLRSLDRISLGAVEAPVYWLFMESQASMGMPAVPQQ